MRIRKIGILACCLLISTWVSAQIPYNYMPAKPSYKNSQSIFMPDTTLNKKRVRAVTGISAGGYAIAYTGIALAWYSAVEPAPFHFFDDSYEWKGVDKGGHFLGGYQGGRGMIQLFKWAGMDRKKSAIYGGLAGGLALVPIEYFDGRAQKWGASVYDIIADVSGGALAATNELLWAEQRLQFKVSYHPTPYADLRPDLFGDSYTKYLKDYNGHTVWLSGRVHSFLPEGKFKSKYPKWLNVAVGYGGDGMLGGYDGGVSPEIRDREFSQYYLALDIDLSQIKTRSGFLDFLLGTINFIHLPSPTLEFNGKRGFLWHWIYM